MCSNKTFHERAMGVVFVLAFFVALIVVSSFFGCSKDDNVVPATEKTTNLTPQILTPEDEVKASLDFVQKYGSGRSGLLLNILNVERMVTDNYMQASTAGYKNRQMVFNKDSVNTITLSRISQETVVIGKTHGIFLVAIDYKNPAMQDYTDIVYSENIKGNVAVIPMSGVNYGTGINTYLTYTRETRSMNYYDTTYKKFKNKFYYTVTGPGVNYIDIIPGNLSNSSVFRLLN